MGRMGWSEGLAKTSVLLAEPAKRDEGGKKKRKRWNTLANTVESGIYGTIGHEHTPNHHPTNLLISATSPPRASAPASCCSAWAPS